MPLPTGGPWPPKNMYEITRKFDEWDAWYTGDPTKLRHAYQRAQAVPSDRVAIDRVAQYRGGLLGIVARMWWGRPTGDLNKRHDELHIPIAADLCQMSADLLFSEPPTLTVTDKGTQDRLDTLAGDSLHSTLAESAEIGAALGGVYLRVTWDTTVADAPFLTTVHADAAVPEFTWGRLSAVTFWRTLSTDGQQVLRYLERHELDSNGVGIILHGLYEGSSQGGSGFTGNRFTNDGELGRPVPLTEHPSTAGLAMMVDENSSISTMSPGLAVVYVPNQRPQRRWRKDPVGASLGRSDLDGVEPIMDALDETYSSWMRDVRLAKARLIVPEYMLQNLGAGRGAGFDADQEIYTPLSMPPADNNTSQITAQQFAIRFAEHKATSDELVATILRSVGYSAQTFGEGTAGGAVTATEVMSKERRSYLTRDRKIRLFRPAIADAIEKVLAVDAAIFNSRVAVERPVVSFADEVQADPEALARTAQALRLAQAASTATLVQMQHPDWDGDEIAAEVALVNAEAGMSVPSPFAGPAVP